MVGDRDRMLSAGFNGYISKPIDPETFVSQVESFLEPSQRVNRAEPAPVAKPVSEPAPMQRESVEPGALVLVVDDTEANRHLLRYLLQPHGYVIIEARTIAEAMTMARERRPSVILCDINLGHESGYEIYRRLSEDPQLRRIPFIMISSTDWPSPARLEQDQALQSVKFMLRPTEPEPLLAAIEESLRRQKAA